MLSNNPVINALLMMGDSTTKSMCYSKYNLSTCDPSLWPYLCPRAIKMLSAETQRAYVISFSTDYAPEPFQALRAVITCVPASRHLSPNPQKPEIICVSVYKVCPPFRRPSRERCEHDHLH